MQLLASGFDSTSGSSTPRTHGHGRRANWWAGLISPRTRRT